MNMTWFHKANNFLETGSQVIYSKKNLEIDFFF